MSVNQIPVWPPMPDITGRNSSSNTLQGGSVLEMRSRLTTVSSPSPADNRPPPLLTSFLSTYLNAKLKVLSNYHPAMWGLIVIYTPVLGAVLIGGTLTIDDSTTGTMSWPAPSSDLSWPFHIIA